MIRGPSRKVFPAEAGYALIEVVVSALIITLVTGGVIQLLTSTGHASADQRHRSQAYAVAQEDQARLRSMQIQSLQIEMAPRTVTLNSTPYTVTSTASFVSDKTGTTKCGSEGRADYVRVGSAVTWPTMREGSSPVTIESIVSPVTGSVDATAGGLAISVHNATGQPISGVGITGSGTGSFSGSTNFEGCALFGGQPAGEYTVTPRLGSEYVEPSGEKPAPIVVSIVGGTTIPVTREYDRAGTINLSFSTRNSLGAIVAAKSDSIVAAATGMKTARTFGVAGGTPQTAIAATPLYPFTYPYNLYAGSCTVTPPESAATANVNAPAGSSTAATVRLPALYLTVNNSKGTAAEAIGIGGAKVTLRDLKCLSAGKPIVRTYTTTATASPRIGALAEIASPTVEAPGVPTGEYELCASANVGGSLRRLTKTVLLKSVNGVAVTMDLGSGYEVGEC
jgi:type II secretory pathway pseudopilin PulG